MRHMFKCHYSWRIVIKNITRSELTSLLAELNLSVCIYYIQRSSNQDSSVKQQLYGAIGIIRYESLILEIYVCD